MPTISKGLKQAYDLQDLSYSAAKMMGAGLSESGKLSREDAIALTALVRAWESCQERIRIHRNKPLPGSRRPAPEIAATSGGRQPKNRLPGVPTQFGFPPVYKPTAQTPAG